MSSSYRDGKNKIALFAAMVLIASISAGSGRVQAQAPTSAPAQKAPPKTDAAAQGGTKKTPATTAARAYDRALLRPALLKDKAPEQYKVKFVTTRGEFILDVTRAWAPLGADRFYNLVKHHFYDNASLFRVVPGFVAQFGISAYPAVTTAWKGTEIKDDPVTQSNKKGYITFATAGANTRTTQVFINLVDNVRLDRMGFAPFGVVEADGMKVVEMFYDQYGDTSGPDQGKIESQGKSYVDKGWPKLDTIKSATLLTSAPAAASKPATPAKKPQ
jgi:peptidyl-prolyl cis-trans isomerase A (cyclophilin A)